MRKYVKMKDLKQPITINPFQYAGRPYMVGLFAKGASPSSRISASYAVL